MISKREKSDSYGRGTATIWKLVSAQNFWMYYSYLPVLVKSILSQWLEKNICEIIGHISFSKNICDRKSTISEVLLYSVKVCRPRDSLNPPRSIKFKADIQHNVSETRITTILEISCIHIRIVDWCWGLHTLWQAGRRESVSHQKSQLQLMIPLKDVWLYFGNFLPWLHVHAQTSKTIITSLFENVWVSNWHLMLFKDRISYLMIFGSKHYETAKLVPQRISIKSFEVGWSPPLAEYQVTQSLQPAPLIG